MQQLELSALQTSLLLSYSASVLKQQGRRTHRNVPGGPSRDVVQSRVSPVQTHHRCASLRRPQAQEQGCRSDASTAPRVRHRVLARLPSRPKDGPDSVPPTRATWADAPDTIRQSNKQRYCVLVERYKHLA